MNDQERNYLDRFKERKRYVKAFEPYFSSYQGMVCLMKKIQFESYS